MSESTITVTLSRDEIHALREALYTEIRSLRSNVDVFVLDGESESSGARYNHIALNRCEDLRYNLSQALSNAKERRSATAVVWTELSPTHVTSSHGEIVCNPKGAWWITLAGHLTASCAFLNLSDAKAWVLANAVEVSA